MKKFYTRSFSLFVWSPVYEGEDDKKTDDKKDDKKEKLLTQEQVNAIVAAERKKYETQVGNLSTELEAVKSRSNLTAQEREALEARLLEYKTESLSKEEQAKLKLKNEQTKWETENKTLKEQNERAVNRYRQFRIEKDLIEAAAAAKAFNPRTVVALLERNTELRDVLGDDGKPTGADVVKVKYETKGADGKLVTLELEPSEVVKRLAESEEHAFMFQSSGSGGGGNNNRGSGGKVTGIEAVSGGMETYKRHRADINSGKLT